MLDAIQESSQRIEKVQVNEKIKRHREGPFLVGAGLLRAEILN